MTWNQLWLISLPQAWGVSCKAAGSSLCRHLMGQLWKEIQAAYRFPTAASFTYRDRVAWLSAMHHAVAHGLLRQLAHAWKLTRYPGVHSDLLAALGRSALSWTNASSPPPRVWRGGLLSLHRAMTAHVRYASCLSSRIPKGVASWRACQGQLAAESFQLTSPRMAAARPGRQLRALWSAHWRASAQRI